jgi:hypothetical protein
MHRPWGMHGGIATKSVTPYSVFEAAVFLQTQIAKSTTGDAFWRDAESPYATRLFKDTQGATREELGAPN